ncbi:MAG: hypothetical protein KJO21_11680 [Verrucomicrobiae bacterium]|nr:hypothetical protein [Verrucomicrobiae bacterium]NNJ43688.1 hypothetical protein [Akkermansiaceae bacterium]
MKTSIFTLILLMIAQSQLHAGNLFREVTVGSDSWEIIFHKQGGRYRIEIDAVNRGTSGYLQRLRLLPKESLRLIDKHWYMDIKPADREGKKGLEITRTYHDRLTGAKKTQTTFEPNHRAEQSGEPDS